MADLDGSEDEDSDDAPLDFHHLIPRNNGHALPRRGIKDFEYHGTNSQISVLERSRQAMHEAVSVGRVHGQKGLSVGYLDAVFGEEGRLKGRVLGGGTGSGGVREERVVVVERQSGQHMKSMGVSDKNGSLWLLPEEVVYLVERGSLDVRYRVSGDQEKQLQGKRSLEGEEQEGEARDEAGDGGGQGWNDVSMSLQACYAHFVGRDDLTLERYTVYAGLKRSGYIVTRAPGWYGGHAVNQQALGGPRGQTAQTRQSIWRWLYTTLLPTGMQRPPHHPLKLGPLVTPGLYRSYGMFVVSSRSVRSVQVCMD